MKKLLLSLTFLSHFVYSQTVPLGINYQAVIRNNVGSVATNSIISLKFELYNTATATSFTYAETHINLNTGPMGVVTSNIGMGAPTTGYSFNNVNWAGGDVWYQVSLNLGSGFTPIGGKQKFMTVPYAFYAAKAPAPTLTLTGNVLSTLGGNSVIIPSGGSLTSTITGQGLAVVTPTSGSVFNVSVPTPSLNFSSNSLTIKQGAFVSNAVTIAPTLSLNTSTGVLYSGVVSNSVSLFSLPTSTLWTQSGGSLYPNNSVNVGIGTNTPLHKLHVNKSTSVDGAAIFASNSDNGLECHGLKAFTTSNNTQSAALWGQNTGAGASLYAVKFSGLSGNAGRFILTPPSVSFNTDAAVYIEKNGNFGTDIPALLSVTNGTAAAVYAKSNNPNSPLALEVGGHIKSSGVSPTTTILTENLYMYSGSPVTTSMNTTYTNTDVSGNVRVNFPTALSVSNASGTSGNYSYVVVSVVFNKSYSSIPKILLTPVVNNYFQIFDFSITSQTTSGFDVLINYSFGSGSSVSNVSFNYLAIE